MLLNHQFLLCISYFNFNLKLIVLFLLNAVVAKFYNNVYNKDEGMRLYNNFTTLKQRRNGGCSVGHYSQGIYTLRLDAGFRRV